MFTETDLERGKKLAENLNDILNAANETIDSVEVTEEEREELVEAVANPTVSVREMPEQQFLELLAREEAKANRTNGFVGLQRFIRNHISWAGYSSQAVRELISRLEQEKKIILDKVENPNGEHPTTAIRAA